MSTECVRSLRMRWRSRSYRTRYGVGKRRSLYGGWIWGEENDGIWGQRKEGRGEKDGFGKEQPKPGGLTPQPLFSKEKEKHKRIF